MSKLTGLVCVVTLAACGGGGGGSPRAACEDYAETYCAQVYACLTEAERGLLGLPATEAGCITQVETAAGCENQTEENACNANETYHGDKASQCVDQLGNLECAQLRDGFDADVDAPACNEVCTVD
jgi:hypothetical protein